MLNEADTRARLIEPKLKEAGWTDAQITREHSYQSDVLGGKVDYLLRITEEVVERFPPKRRPIIKVLLQQYEAFPIAVVEAKAESVRSLEAGLEQAKRYARDLDLKFAYVTNGHEIIEYDFFTNGSRRLDRFPSPQELLQRWLLNSGMFEGSSNRLKTVALLVLLTVLLSGLGGLVAGPTGLTVALVAALLMNGLAYGFSDRIVLALHGAEPLSEDEAPDVHRIVRDLTRRLGIPMPRLYRVPTETPNAFATGRDPDHAAVAVTDGILRLLSPEELEGVLAHELLHVVNGDTLITTVTAVIAGAVMYLARMVRWAFLLMGRMVQWAFLLMGGLLIRLGVSRTREYMADELGARLVGRPDGLIGALRKIEDFQRRVPADAPSPATAHLYFSKPRTNRLVEWLSAHPPVEERINRLIRRVSG